MIFQKWESYRFIKCTLFKEPDTVTGKICGRGDRPIQKNIAVPVAGGVK